MTIAQHVEMMGRVGRGKLEPDHECSDVDAVSNRRGLPATEPLTTSTHASTVDARPRANVTSEWAMRASIPRLPRCERGALPTELIALGDPSGYCSRQMMPMPWRSRIATVSESHRPSNGTSARATPSFGAAQSTSYPAPRLSSATHDPGPTSPSGPRGTPRPPTRCKMKTRTAPPAATARTSLHGNRARATGDVDTTGRSVADDDRDDAADDEAAS